MDMSDGNVVERIEDAHVHVVYAPERKLGIGSVGLGSSVRDELVGQRHVAHAGIEGTGVGNEAQGIGVGDDFFIGEEGTHEGGLQEGKKPEYDGAVLVFEGDVRDFAVVCRRKMDAVFREQVRCVGHALGRIVVARDGDACGARLCDGG